MRKLVLIGGGGHCRSVLDAALRSNCFDEIVITDTQLKIGGKILGCTIAATDAELPKLKAGGFDFAFVSIGSIKSTKLREHLADQAEQLGFRFPVIIDPSATVSANAVIAEGTFVGKHAVINAGASIGKHCIINTGAIVEHDCSIGDFTHVSVGAILCGAVHVGKSAFIGAGSTIIQEVRIGAKTVIGANSTVIRNVSDGQTLYGLPLHDTGGV